VDLYTLSDTFLAKDTIDKFVSAIWTERYTSMGDCQLVVEDTPLFREQLKEGTYLALRGSKEVMELQTVSSENELLTIVGRSMVGFLDERMAWFKAPMTPEEGNFEFIMDYSELTKPGLLIANTVEKMVIDPEPFVGSFDDANLDWANEVIPGLELGPVDSTGADERLTVTVGPLYTSIQQLAQKYKVGISLYLESADPSEGFVLKFTTYRGKDHTKDGAYPLVRLVPDIDSLGDIKEVRSIAGYKNVCYVYYKGDVHIYYADPDLPIPTGFARRVLVTDPEKEPVGHKVTYQVQGVPGATYTQTVIDEDDVAAFLAQNAKDALANHNYILAVDGQTSPNLDYQFGTDYGLGDIIELESLTGLISKARITEYIRSQDATGEKSYPTISVITGEEGE
jgi:hypothetical protein